MSLFDRILAAADVKRVMVSPDDALAGRPTPMPVRDEHRVLGHRLRGESDAAGEYPPAGIGAWDDGLRAVIFAGGCFWGFEEIFWQVPGVYTTAVGYAGGYTPNPTYEEVCTARTGHAEAVLVVYDPAAVSFAELLEIFYTSHDPTQEMRQGNDIGTQYRSAVFTFDEAEVDRAADAARAFEPVLAEAGYGPVTSQISLMSQAGDGVFYYAEDYHQQYLFTNPNGYRCHAPTGLKFPAV